MSFPEEAGGWRMMERQITKRRHCPPCLDPSVRTCTGWQDCSASKLTSIDWYILALHRVWNVLCSLPSPLITISHFISLKCPKTFVLPNPFRMTFSRLKKFTISYWPLCSSASPRIIFYHFIRSLCLIHLCTHQLTLWYHFLSIYSVTCPIDLCAHISLGEQFLSQR